MSIKEKAKELKDALIVVLCVAGMFGIFFVAAIDEDLERTELEEYDRWCLDNPCDCQERESECIMLKNAAKQREYEEEYEEYEAARQRYYDEYEVEGKYENNEQQPVDERIKDAQKQIEETKKKSELRSTAPQDICIDNYLGAKYKKGTCEFPVYERMTGRAGLEKKFGNCQINEIIPGKNNTATVKAVCMGVPSIIHVKNYKVLQRGSKDGR